MLAKRIWMNSKEIDKFRFVEEFAKSTLNAAES